MFARAISSLSRPMTTRIIPYKMQRALLSSDAFKAAVESSTKLPEDPGNETKLKMYALYKQATVGKCNTKKPGMFDLVGKAKYDAWNALGDMPKGDAEKSYISLVKELGGGATAGAKSDQPPAAPGEDNSVAGLTVTNDHGIMTLRLNNPRRKNPITIEIYDAISSRLSEAAKDPKCRVVVITGTGDYYSSGNDLGNFAKMMASIPPDSKDPLAASAECGRVVLSKFQEALIDFPKPLIALVNGPAVGIPVTTLCLCDAVLASEKATFSTPFTNLAQSPEGCSSFLFPLTMGALVASDVLLFGRVLNAKEAEQVGLVSRVLPADTFAASSAAFVKHVASLPPNALVASKRLLRSNHGQLLSRETLHKVSREECRVLALQWQSEECVAAITNFMSRKQKSSL